jgi:periplasmic divalent cation tolerance protein
MGETQFVVVMTTAGSEEQATNLGQELVERRLAACVNIISQVCSIYRWKGKVWQDEEKVLLVKTAAHLVPAVRDAIRELHTYELPEVIMMPIQDPDPEILEWLESCLGPEEARRPGPTPVEDTDEG